MRWYHLLFMSTTLASPTNSEQPTHIGTGRWRLLTGREHSGALNMAIDEALLESVIAGGPPVLRFYAWQPATLSLGTNQPAGEVDAEECERRGFSLVRRLTGGRAVLHQHELTYSVVARENDPLVSGGVVESYRKISTALVAGLHILGADVELAQPSRALHRAPTEARRNGGDADLSTGSHGAVCFDAASDYELTAGGLKLVGSAQARRGGALLQHGSLLLDVDWDAWASVFSYRTEAGRERARQKLPTRMTSLAAVLGRDVSVDEVEAALIDGFAQTFKADFVSGTLSPEEQAQARTLEKEKYANRDWTLRK